MLWHHEQKTVQRIFYTSPVRNFSGQHRKNANEAHLPRVFNEAVGGQPVAASAHDGVVSGDVPAMQLPIGVRLQDMDLAAAILFLSGERPCQAERLLAAIFKLSDRQQYAQRHLQSNAEEVLAWLHQRHFVTIKLAMSGVDSHAPCMAMVTTSRRGQRLLKKLVGWLSDAPQGWSGRTMVLAMYAFKGQDPAYQDLWV